MQRNEGSSDKRVVVVGGGVGGLAAARALGRNGIPTTVIDQHNYHLFVPLLYQVATASLSPADIAEPIRRLLRRYSSVDVLLGSVTGVEHATRAVALGDGRHIPYDFLVLATGTDTAYFGNDEWARFAPGLKTVSEARTIRERLLSAFERAEQTDDAAEQARLMTTVVIGGGSTGVEIAGAASELVHRSMASDFRHIDARNAQIVLIERDPRLLPGYPPGLQDYARRCLEKLGVTVLPGETVEQIRPDGVQVGGRFIGAGTIIWGAGITASPAARWLGTEADRMGRVVANADLSVPGREGVFVLGDTAHVADADGAPLPPLGQVASQQGAHLGRGLAALIKSGQPIPDFRFKNKGNAAIIGRNAAVFDFGRRQLKGWFAWLSWALIHIYLLADNQNRLLVALQWFWRYLTFKHGARIIEGQEPSTRR